jgi:hypothetical protein
MLGRVLQIYFVFFQVFVDFLEFDIFLIVQHFLTSSSVRAAVDVVCSICATELTWRLRRDKNWSEVRVSGLNFVGENFDKFL